MQNGPRTRPTGKTPRAVGWNVR